ncbi:hypothetical protein B6N31_06960 [Dickeya fangzhongdai]|nr:hypothetical protein B6N31_06960 [Dickeya fangzhongdai]
MYFRLIENFGFIERYGSIKKYGLIERFGLFLIKTILLSRFMLAQRSDCALLRKIDTPQTFIHRIAL